jgi:uncharacterized protein YbbC (DUF1343 family)
MGELARFYQSTRVPNVRLDVIACDGWTRPAHFDATGLPWVLPSPNMPTTDTPSSTPGCA